MSAEDTRRRIAVAAEIKRLTDPALAMHLQANDNGTSCSPRSGRGGRDG